jgi:5-methylcytosine-specific restriction endonuclease McrA
MRNYSRSHLADDALLRGFASHAADERGSLAEVLADIVEVEKRKLYRPAGYPSMLAYCTDERRFTRDAARRRIHAAHVAAKFPAVFGAVAEGRLDLSGVLALARHLTPANADEMISAAAYKSRFEIEQLIAEWAPKLDVPTQVEVVDATAAPGPQETPSLLPPSTACAPARTVSPAERTKLEPLAPGRLALHMTITQEMYDDLCYAQALDSHAVPSGEPALVLARALKEYVRRLEQRRFASSARSHRGKGGHSKNPRYIPPPVRREVWLRDGGQCAFVSESGKRCPSRERLEIDHLDLVGRRSHPSESGPPTAERLRLCCKAHNQHAAEQVYGVEFMQEKRAKARRKAAEAKLRKEARRQVENGSTTGDEAPPPQAAPLVPRNGMVVTAAELRELGGWNRRGAKRDEDPDRDVAPWLRALKCSREEIQLGMELCEAIPDATMEEKLKYAIKGITRGLNRKIPCAAPSPSA